MGLRLIKLPVFNDKRGSLTVWDRDVPFVPKRVFWIYNVPEGQNRANHGHKECEQAIFAVRGSFMVNDTRLYNTSYGLYIPVGEFIKLWDFTPNAICLVLCSEYYDQNDIDISQIEEISEGV